MEAGYCGVDFGTSNSTVGIVKNGQPVLVPVEDSQSTIPSAIFFSFEDEHTLFGRSAIKEYIDGTEGRLMRALKSVLGSKLIHEKTWIKGKEISFREIIGLFIGNLKAKAERQAGASIPSVVLGRPVHFVDNNPQEDSDAQQQLLNAALEQGFKYVEFQFEPIAAALDYEQQVTSEKVALIVDIGGGTSDFSIVRVSPERAKFSDRRDDILSYAGVHVGGTDFDRLFSLDKVMPLFGYRSKSRINSGVLPSFYFHHLATWHLINKLYSKQIFGELKQLRGIAQYPELIDRLIYVIQSRQGHAIAAKVEDVKIQLTSVLETPLSVKLPTEELRQMLSRTQFNDSIAEAVQQCVATVRETLALASLSPGQIQSLFLTGGSSMIPMVRNQITGLFPNAEVVEGDMFASVGLGLALDAKRKFG